MKKWHLIVDVALCQGCNNCFMACKDEHVGNEWRGYSLPQSLHGERWITLPCNERGQYPVIDVAYRPTLCTHCGDAPCVSRAKGAITKRPDGIVLVDPQRAAGHPELVDACPYGMITWNEESNAPQKCTLCAHLLDDKWDKPRCVQACGPGALTFVHEDDAQFTERVAAEGLETLHGGRAEDAGVLYKNLARFDKCFIAGSVARSQDGVVDCLAGVTVLLSPGKTAQPGSPLQTTVTDVFGDFKFDGLEPESGEYLVRVVIGEQPVAEAEASLGHSVTLGTLLVEGGR